MLPTSTEAWSPSKGRNHHHQLYAVLASLRDAISTWERYAGKEPFWLRDEMAAEFFY